MTNMTKYEMVLDIVKHTDFSGNGLDTAYLKRMVSGISLDRVEQIYKLFLNDKEHASYYFLAL